MGFSIFLFGFDNYGDYELVTDIIPPLIRFRVIIVYLLGKSKYSIHMFILYMNLYIYIYIYAVIYILDVFGFIPDPVCGDMKLGILKSTIAEGIYLS